MKNPNSRNLHAIAAQFRNSAGAMASKKDRKQNSQEWLAEHCKCSFDQVCSECLDSAVERSMVQRKDSNK